MTTANIQYVIRSVNRPEGRNYFAAIHSFTPFFSGKDKARPFDSREEASMYALAELFENRSAYAVEPLE